MVLAPPPYFFRILILHSTFFLYFIHFGPSLLAYICFPSLKFWSIYSFILQIAQFSIQNCSICTWKMNLSHSNCKIIFSDTLIFVWWCRRQHKNSSSAEVFNVTSKILNSLLACCSCVSDVIMYRNYSCSVYRAYLYNLGCYIILPSCRRCTPRRRFFVVCVNQLGPTRMGEI